MIENIKEIVYIVTMTSLFTLFITSTVSRALELKEAMNQDEEFKEDVIWSIKKGIRDISAIIFIVLITTGNYYIIKIFTDFNNYAQYIGLAIIAMFLDLFILIWLTLWAYNVVCSNELCT